MNVCATGHSLGLYILYRVRLSPPSLSLTMTVGVRVFPRRFCDTLYFTTRKHFEIYSICVSEIVCHFWKTKIGNNYNYQPNTHKRCQKIFCFVSLCQLMSRLVAFCTRRLLQIWFLKNELPSPSLSHCRFKVVFSVNQFQSVEMCTGLIMPVIVFLLKCQVMHFLLNHAIYVCQWSGDNYIGGNF